MKSTLKPCFFCLLISLTLSAASQADELNTYIQGVWQHNKQIKVIKFQRDNSRQNVRAQSGLYDPTLQAKINQKSDSNNPSTQQTAASLAVAGKTPSGADLGLTLQNTLLNQSSDYNTALNLALTQPLTSGSGQNETEYQLNLARLDDRKADYTFQKNAAALIQNALASYFDYLLNLKNRDILLSNLNHTAFVYQENLKKEKLNLATPYDTMESELDYKKAQDDLAAAHNTISRNVDELAQWADLDFDLEGTLPSLPRPIPLNRLAVTDNPDLAAARLDLRKLSLKLAHDHVQAAIGTYMDASYGLSGQGTSLPGSAAFSESNYSIGLRMSYVLNNTSNQATLAMDQLQIDQQTAAYQEQQAALEINLRSLQRDQISLYDRINTAKDIVTLAEAFLQIEKRKFSLGLITTDKMVQDQNQLSTAKYTYYKLQMDYLKNYYQLLTYQGQLLNSLGLTLGRIG